MIRDKDRDMTNRDYYFILKILTFSVFICVEEYKMQNMLLKKISVIKLVRGVGVRGGFMPNKRGGGDT